jgi:hypothetical protein
MNYPDIFLTAEYQDLFKDTAFGGEPCRFTCAGIDYRFYKRPIEGTPYFDIVSPYGYSGPISIGDADWKTYFSEFNQFCLDNNIVAEFARLHPFLNSAAADASQWDYEHDIYYIDLTKSEDEIWKGFTSSCRNHIKQAQKGGLRLEFNMDVMEFSSRYNLSMDRLNASDNYYFGTDFWDKLSKMGILASVGKTASWLLIYGDYCHYFLSIYDGTNGAANLLLWESIQWAKMKGCKIFNLGGGLKSKDSLEEFKRSFTKLSKLFYTYRKIHNQEVYEGLCKLKGTDPTSSGFFPAYRRDK